MANRYFSQNVYSLAKQPVMLFGRVTFGASGAPTLDATNSKGIKTIVRNSAGKYTITLGNSASGVDIYPRLFNFQAALITGTSAAAAPCMVVVSEAVASATPTVVIQFRAIDNSTATDPASGEEMRFTVTLTNSNAP